MKGIIYTISAARDLVTGSLVTLLDLLLTNLTTWSFALRKIGEFSRLVESMSLSWPGDLLRVVVLLLSLHVKLDNCLLLMRKTLHSGIQLELK